MSISFKDNIGGGVDKLNSSAGSSTQPVYFSNGKPVATTYTLGCSVPSNAKFTDTNTTYSTGSSTYSGLTRLYSSTGSNTNGTMTQSAITTALNGKLNNVSNIEFSDNKINFNKGNSYGTGKIHSSNGLFLYANRDVGISCNSSLGQIEIFACGYNSSHINLENYDPDMDYVYYDFFFDNYGFSPCPDDTMHLGQSNLRWNDIYCSTSVISTSDRNYKKDINNLDIDLTKSFILGLNPSSYKLIHNNSNRTHYGLIAQDVEDLMTNLNMTSLDFAGFIKSPKIVEETIVDEETGKTKHIKKTLENEYIYSLRYEEFIAPLIKMVQIQQEEINELNNKIITYENSINEIKKEIEELKKE